LESNCIEDYTSFTRCKMGEKYSSSKHLEVIVPNITDKLLDNWKNCAGFKIHKFNAEEKIYKVTRLISSSWNNGIRYALDVSNKHCTCGKWQDRQYPWVDACACYEQLKKIEFIYEELVSSYYIKMELHYHLKEQGNNNQVNQQQRGLEVDQNFHQVNHHFTIENNIHDPT
jgi:hypothetical protein